MNPLKYAQMMKYLTRAKKVQPDLPDVFSASKAPIPAKTQEVEEIEAINRFMRANPRTEKAGGGRIGFSNGPPGFQPGNKMNLRRREGNPGNIKALEKIIKKKTAIKDKKVNKFVELVEKGDTTTEAKNKVIELFKLKRSKKAGTPPWMTQGKNILIDKGILKPKEKTTQETLGKTENLTSNPDIKKIDTQVKRPAPNIKEVKYKNINTGETFSRFKPVIGESNKTVSGSGFKTLEEAKKIVDNYFKENPKIIRVRNPKKNYDTKDRRIKALLESDPTGAAGTKKFNYHHITQIAGGVPLTTDDVIIINQQINSKIGGKYNEALNRISASIRENNRLALEAMNNKQEGLALDYMKRSDELNAQAEKIVNSAIDDLPKKYKNYVGFKQFTLPRDEYGLPIQKEPMIVKKIGGMPVSKDSIDLTTLTKKGDAEFKKIVKAQAERGEIGAIKLTSADKKILNNIQSYSKLSQCKVGAADGGRIGFAFSDECIRDGLKEKKIAAQNGNKKAAKELVQVGKVATRAGLLKNLLGPGAILGEAVYDGAVIGNKVLGGKPADIAWAESYLSYLDPRKYRGELDPLKMEREDMLESTADKNILRSGFAAQDQISDFNEAIEERDRAKKAGRLDEYNPAAADAREQGRLVDQSADIISSEAFKDATNVAQEYLQGQSGQQQAGFGVYSVPQSTMADEGRRVRAMSEMRNLYPQYSDKDILNILKEYNTDPKDYDYTYTPRNFPADTSSKSVTGFDDIRDYYQQQQATQNIADAGGVANLAEGGVASGPPPVRGPNPQGLLSLKNRVRNY